ncbi:alpha/beta fold hydrolase [Xanthobacteraceae bacterium Astr-EGSB]|uniref:alpha/beta fold hydrolase n=1 Tax=Astrobacterium formosum TaxID=3069710 RepID=UPI0027B3292C|nr:alpha/beta fold hydrolase [Xanthobacteraceae bacterium Astr-EGSB]
MRTLSTAAAAFACAAFATLAAAADYPAPKHGEWVARDFKFHTGEVMGEMRIAYTTVGEPTGEPVMVLHGTTGSGAGMLTPAFAGELFGPGQPLDAKKYFIILPDSVGHGRSAKPSDGLRTKFPRYNYDDMVAAQHRLLTEHLGIRHLRLIIGNSMGGMETWIWGTTYPEFADVLVPMAAQPTAMSSRNWILRRLLVEMVQSDPDYKNGDYTSPPKALKLANVFFGLATSGGNIALQKAAPTSAKGDDIVKARLAAPMNADANDFIYQWESSRDYDPSARLERISAPLLAINAADDERNPPETGLMDAAMKRVKNGRLLLIPGSEATRGHGTTGNARFYAKELGEILQTAPRRSM